MDNQHKLIHGYRELSQTEIDLMNEIKSKGAECAALINKLFAEKADERWLAIGTNDLQTGFMALTRSIAKPTTF